MSHFKKSKIALVHDTYTYFGGAERVLLKFIDMFPSADVYTSVIAASSKKKLEKISKGKIYSSRISRFEFVKNHPDFFKPYILLYWQCLNLNKYDVVISSSHSFCSNWVNVKGKHISYIYTPPRYLYTEYNEMEFLRKFPFKQIFKLPFELIRNINYKKVQKINKIIAISKIVQKRILKYYDRDSVVVYPPVNVKGKLSKKSVKKEYYLFFSRLVKQKGVYLALEAFNTNGRKILFIGTGKESDKLKKLANPNITFVGFKDDADVTKILSKAKALIYCSIEEDFGMIPIEVMSYGVPVIAYKSGGTEETIIDGKTGIFFTRYTVAALNNAIQRFEKSIFSPRDCYNQAKKFGAPFFEKNITTVLNHV